MKETKGKKRPSGIGPSASTQRPPDLNEARLELIVIELDLGYTFATIARQSNDEEKKARNRMNARRAYDAAVQAAAKAIPGEREAQITEAFQRLRTELEQLGETAL